MAQNDSTPTPRAVTKNATERTEVNLNRLVLLGTFGTDGSRRALLRLPDGRVARVARGDQVGHETVYAIDDARIALGRNGTATWVTMPGG